MHFLRTLVLLLTVSSSFALGLPGANAGETSTYAIDTTHSRIGFKIRHKMVSLVPGQFNTFSGTINYDPANIGATTAKVEIDPASIDTSNEKRDGHLRADDFFDVEKFPTMSFESTEIKDIGKDGTFTMVGNLTMRGVTKPVELNFSRISDQVGKKRGVSVTGSLNRQDFGISWSRLLDNGGLAVGNEVRFDFDIELNAS